MAERSIILYAPEIPGLLAGTVTQIRRPVAQVPDWLNTWERTPRSAPEALNTLIAKCPFGTPGDRLWVREAYVFINAQREHNEICIAYSADGEALLNRPSIFVTPKQFAHFMGDNGGKIDPFKKRRYPGIFMPRWASRITLELLSIRVERAQNISEEDARACGIQVLPLQSADDPSAWWQSAPGVHQDRTPALSYRKLWDSLFGKRYQWVGNPWVWVYGVRKI